ncbi:MAG: hypothetical protein J6A69_05325 [Clostridia bacterium]|nr:hypothetical protein [Clostridia bacterium]
MNTEKSSCSLLRSIEQCVKGVMESYAYNEVIHTYGNDTDNAVCDIILSEITDEILPVRIYSSMINNSVMVSAICGSDSSKAAAEQVALMINAVLGNGIEKISVKLGNTEKWDNVKEHLDSYGYTKYLDGDAKLGFDGFMGVSENEKLIFEGFAVELSGKKCLYSKIHMDVLMDLLSHNAQPESKLLPVALVASDESSLSFSVALGLRSQGLKIEEYTGTGSMIEAEEYAELKGITILLWISGNTVMMKNLKNGERSETTVDKLLQNK